MAMSGYIARLSRWVLRIVLPLTLLGMLAAPALLDPPQDMAAAACAAMPEATILPVGGSDDQFTFLRLQAPRFIVVERRSNGALVVGETQMGMWLWLCGLVLLAVTTWWVWRPRRSSH